MRVEAEPAFVIHSRPYRESSLLLEALTLHYGRVGLVARGARRLRSGLRGLLQPFQALLLGWSGRGELHTLTMAEPARPPYPLAGRALAGGLHLNVLVYVSLARDDPHPEVFAAYHEALEHLAAAHGTAVDLALRRFELRLLSALGYAPVLDRDVQGRPVEPGEVYTYDPGRGAVHGCRQQEGMTIRGETLLALAGRMSMTEAQAAEARRFMRALLEHHLGDRHRHIRDLLEKVARPLARASATRAEVGT